MPNRPDLSPPEKKIKNEKNKNRKPHHWHGQFARLRKLGYRINDNPNLE
jgi:hypothetical protein